jgi:hypothetical protein
MFRSSEPWSGRFIAAAIIQGAAIVSLTTVLVIASSISIIKPDVARVLAAGGAGTWFMFGYLIYIVVGVIGVAVSALFYHLLSTNNISNFCGWTHLILMNVGTAAAASMLMYAGYSGGAAALSTAVGGRGLSPMQVHEIIVPFVEPIGASILLIMAGVIAGGIGYLIAYYRSKTKGNNGNL